MDAKWYGTVTAGNRAPQVEFASSVLPLGWMCTTVFPWFTPSSMDCRVWSQVIAFGGAYRFTVFRTHLWQKTPAILKWSSTIMTVTHVCIYIYMYIRQYMYVTNCDQLECLWGLVFEKETWPTIYSFKNRGNRCFSHVFEVFFCACTPILSLHHYCGSASM